MASEASFVTLVSLYLLSRFISVHLSRLSFSRRAAREPAAAAAARSEALSTSAVSSTVSQVWYVGHQILLSAGSPSFTPTDPPSLMTPRASQTGSGGINVGGLLSGLVSFNCFAFSCSSILQLICSAPPHLARLVSSSLAQLGGGSTGSLDLGSLTSLLVRSFRFSPAHRLLGKGEASLTLPAPCDIERRGRRRSRSLEHPQLPRASRSLSRSLSFFLSRTSRSLHRRN